VYVLKSFHPRACSSAGTKEKRKKKKEKKEKKKIDKNSNRFIRGFARLQVA
jgi:hypothetical protein